VITAKFQSKGLDKQVLVTYAEELADKVDRTTDYEDIVNDFSGGIVELEDDVSLRDRLIAFGNSIVSPKTESSDSSLLRPAMLEALLQFLPCSKAEFFEVIPGYLRAGTSANEGEYLDEVLEIISEYA
jgi:hypothetical protein